MKENTNLPFSSPEFAQAWAEWEQHRKEIKKKLTPTTAHRQLNKLSSMGEKRAIAALQYSITNGWMGIYEPKGETSGGAAENSRFGDSPY